MADNKITVQQIKKAVQIFVQKRDWEKFHTPKNLSMSLAIETSELMEIFQWLTADEANVNQLTDSQKERIEEEIADIGLPPVIGPPAELVLQLNIRCSAQPSRGLVACIPRRCEV